MKNFFNKNFCFSFFLVIGFFPFVSSQDVKKTIQSYLEGNHLKNGLSESDIKNWEITNQTYDKKIHVTHVYIRQIFNSLPLANGLGNFAIKNGEVVVFGNRFVQNIEKQFAAVTPSFSAKEAIEKAASQLDIANTKKIYPTKTISKTQFIYSKGSISNVPIPIELMYFQKYGVVVLVWDLKIKENKSSNWWSIKLNATTGEIIEKNNWTISCTFENCSDQAHVHSTPKESDTPAPPPSSSQYNVYPIPIESPSHGTRSIVSNPANLDASPFGWHDDNGTAGNEYTITRGNNVYATEDADNDDLPGYSPEGGVSLNFNFPIDLNLSPTENLDPAITNLFYMNNIMHDVWYKYGFDEGSGNFQSFNYSSEGISDDYVLAEAQDGSGTNNANFSTPPDGYNPRMQMYLWSTVSNPDNLIIHTPSAIAGTYDLTRANFGSPVVNPITSDFVLVNDGIAPDANDGCESILNSSNLVGKIAIVNRGNCTFTEKVQALQDAGAIAAIVINNVTSAPTAMGGAGGSSIFIPSFMISQATGQLLLTQLSLNTTINGTIQNGGGVISGFDADFDNMIIAHEYGHGISNRLTGGADNTECLNNDEQMGEGWSDFFGLMLTQKTTDLPATGRGVGTYVSGEPVTATGIRNAPYSTDFAINNYTYTRTNNDNISKPHGIGFIWCTMLWDLNWAFIDQYGFNADMYEGTGGNNKLMHIVIEALKLQPCGPGFVDGRDAILAADQLLNNGVNKCMIWEVFARRGLGLSADQGDPGSRLDQVEAFDVPIFCNSEIKENHKDAISIYPNPTTNSITVDFKENEGLNKIVLSDVLGKVIFQAELNNSNQLTVDMSKLTNGIYMLNLNDGKNYKIIKKE
jgi:extracellular elastinolytic metalloproteinase